jgi:hypothetical protein
MERILGWLMVVGYRSSVIGCSLHAARADR